MSRGDVGLTPVGGTLESIQPAQAAHMQTSVQMNPSREIDPGKFFGVMQLALRNGRVAALKGGTPGRNNHHWFRSCDDGFAFTAELDAAA